MPSHAPKGSPRAFLGSLFQAAVDAAKEEFSFKQRVVIGAVTPVAQAGIDQGLAPRLDAGCQMVPVHPV